MAITGAQLEHMLRQAPQAPQPSVILQVLPATNTAPCYVDSSFTVLHFGGAG